MIYTTCVFEDEPSHLAMLKMLSFFPDVFSEHIAIPCYGYGKIKKRIAAYNQAAKYQFFFILTDLDKYECAPALINEWLPSEQTEHNPQLFFRVAVHEIESWLLADRENFAEFFAVNKNLIPMEPDKEIDPKKAVVSLASKSRKRSIKEAIIPIDEYASIGPEYNMAFRNYIQNYWDISNARKHSPSFEKAMQALEKIVNQCNIREG
jgi:hypothetical protein